MSPGDRAWFPRRQLAAGGLKSVSVLRAIVQWNAGFELPGLDENGDEEIVYVLEGTFVEQCRRAGHQ